MSKALHLTKRIRNADKRLMGIPVLRLVNMWRCAATMGLEAKLVVAQTVLTSGAAS
jgi:hypothetical protein